MWKFEFEKCRVCAFCVLVAAGVAISGSIAPALAQSQPTEAQILNSLKSPGKTTRGISAPTHFIDDARAANERRFIEGLSKRTTRSLTIDERERVAEIAKSMPSIDLEINFEFNSDKVGSGSVNTLIALGRALSTDELKGSVFLVSGHTDGKGSAEYNQDLSERRAKAVKQLLIEQFKLPPTTLVAIGYGKTQLKNTGDPFASENRRVQIVNTELK
jgi:outer membrane protein OmpA-like peptidoglycan-associated protein